MKRVIIALLMVSLAAMNAQAAAGIGPYMVQKSSDELRPPPDSKSTKYLPAVWRLAQVDIDAGKEYTGFQGKLDGEMYAERVATGGNFAYGVAWGLLFGLIGTGICYYLTDAAAMGSMEYREIEGKGADYERGFQNGFHFKSKSRKRGAALIGGIVGSLGAGAILFTALR